MEKDGLRPCIVEIMDYSLKNPFVCQYVKQQTETHKGYFHTWASESYVTGGFLVGMVAGRTSTLYGVVEYEDGTVHRVPPECITFTDKQNTDVNIDYDAIGKAAAKAIKENCSIPRYLYRK